MKTYTVYKLENTTNHKVYIGYTSQTRVSCRWNCHKHLALAGKSKLPIYNAIRKYGWDSFNKSIIFQTKDKKEALMKETFFIKEYNSFGEGGYNLSFGGEMGNARCGEKNGTYKIRKGRPMKEWFTEEACRNNQIAMRKFKGSGNPRAKIYILVSPEGNEEVVHGRLFSFCKDHNLSFPKMYSFIDKGKIPPLSKMARHITKPLINCLGWECRLVIENG